jgi:hypothetical protein
MRQPPLRLLKHSISIIGNERQSHGFKRVMQASACKGWMPCHSSPFDNFHPKIVQAEARITLTLTQS